MAWRRSEISGQAGTNNRSHPGKLWMRKFAHPAWSPSRRSGGAMADLCPLTERCCHSLAEMRGMKSGSKAKVRRDKAHAARIRNEAAAATNDLTRQQLLERAAQLERSTQKAKRPR